MPWKLDKYYFDLQSPDGRIWIGYRASLEFRGLRLPYSASIFKAPGLKTELRQSLRRGGLSTSPQGARWSNRAFKCDYQAPVFEQARPGLKFENEDGRIDWQVQGFGGMGRLSLPAGLMEGRSYWERLKLTLPPWKLPFPELKWGRFLPDEGGPGLVWVAWLGGASEERRLWLGPEARPGLEFFEGGLGYDGGRLKFEQSEAIRQGPLFKNLGGALTPLARLLPGGLGQAFEAKWFSRATLEGSSGQSRGWAVHETVNWRP